MRVSVIAVLLAAAASAAAAQQDVPPTQPSNAPVGDDTDTGPPSRFFGPVEIPHAAELDAWAPVEGVCELTFDVNDFGRVVGSSIVAECTSPDLADPAIGMAARWRYPPPVVEGVPQEQRGVTAEMRFRRPQ
jgi:hypothetical protein